MKFLFTLSLVALISMMSCSQNKNPIPQSKKQTKMELSQKQKAVAVLESLENGNKEAISYINPTKYIQHNLAVGDGLEGFGQVLAHAPEGGFKAKVVRSFEDGEYAFTHTQYDFFGPKVGFDVFRYENGLIVEHWDNLLEIAPANPSGHTQLDGAIAITDLDKTAENKKIVSDFLDVVLIQGQMDKLAGFFDGDNYIQHNPTVGDGLSGFGAAMKAMAEHGITMEYHKAHKVLGEGNFVLAMSEGKFGGKATSFYDLFRIENGKIAEHWDVIETIMPEADWKNQNGKF